MKSLDFNKIGQATKYPAVVRLLAREFADGAKYFSIGQWLKTLSQYDLDLLNELGERFEANQAAGETMVLLTEMLTVAEGVDALDDGAARRVAMLITVLICESLYRKGEIELDHSLISFGEYELKNNKIAWPKGTPRPPKDQNDEA